MYKITVYKYSVFKWNNRIPLSYFQLTIFTWLCVSAISQIFKCFHAFGIKTPGKLQQTNTKSNKIKLAGGHFLRNTHIIMGYSAGTISLILSSYNTTSKMLTHISLYLCLMENWNIPDVPGMQIECLVREWILCLVPFLDRWVYQALLPPASCTS